MPAEPTQSETPMQKELTAEEISTEDSESHSQTSSKKKSVQFDETAEKESFEPSAEQKLAFRRLLMKNRGKRIAEKFKKREEHRRSKSLSQLQSLQMTAMDGIPIQNKIKFAGSDSENLSSLPIPAQQKTEEVVVEDEKVMDEEQSVNERASETPDREWSYGGTEFDDEDNSIVEDDQVSLIEDKHDNTVTTTDPSQGEEVESEIVGGDFIEDCGDTEVLRFHNGVEFSLHSQPSSDSGTTSSSPFANHDSETPPRRISRKPLQNSSTSSTNNPSLARQRLNRKVSPLHSAH